MHLCEHFHSVSREFRHRSMTAHRRRFARRRPQSARLVECRHVAENGGGGALQEQKTTAIFACTFRPPPAIRPARAGACGAGCPAPAARSERARYSLVRIPGTPFLDAVRCPTFVARGCPPDGRVAPPWAMPCVGGDPHPLPAWAAGPAALEDRPRRRALESPISPR